MKKYTYLTNEAILQMPALETFIVYDTSADNKDADILFKEAKAKRSIEGSLNNPNIDPDVKAVLEDALKIANAHIERIDNLFEPYGGIENWNRE